MHEWALAEGVVETARQIAERENLRRVCCVRVKLGALQQIDRGIFSNACVKFLQDADDRIRNASIEFVSEPIHCVCRRCEFAWTIDDDDLARLDDDASESIHFVPELVHAYFRCPTCDSADFSVDRGRGVWVSSVEGSTGDE